MNFELKQRYTIDDLRIIMKILRGENGCPWDREQTHQSIRKNFIEEVYEVVEAIDLSDDVLLQEELGDVLLQVVFHSEMAEEEQRFSFDDVCNDICKKLIVRHPHIFSDVVVKDTDDVLKNWEAIKNAKKGHTKKSESLVGVARSLPALMRSTKVQQRAARAGMDFASVEDAIQKLREEIDELEQELKQQENEQRLQEELGDVLFSVVNTARLLKIDSEEALSESCNKFIDRFVETERLAKKPLDQYDPKELDDLWEQAKKHCSSSVND